MTPSLISASKILTSGDSDFVLRSMLYLRPDLSAPCVLSALVPVGIVGVFLLSGAFNLLLRSNPRRDSRLIDVAQAVGCVDLPRSVVGGTLAMPKMRATAICEAVMIADMRPDLPGSQARRKFAMSPGVVVDGGILSEHV